MISVIIVNYNTQKLLKDCIDSVFRYESDSEFEIIIVDNGSENFPDEAQIIAESLPRLKTIKLERTISFSAANNIGIKNSSGEYIVIMNPDIIFTEPVFKKLICVLESVDTGAVSPALTGRDGNFQRNYFQRYPTVRQFIFYYSILAKAFNKSAKRMNRYLENQEIDISEKKLHYTEQLPFAFFMTKRNIINEVGYLDENYFLFFEDVDLSYRIARKYKLAVDSSVKVLHLGGSSFKSADNWKLHGIFIKSMIYFFKKNYGPLRTFILKLLVKVNSYIVLIIEYIQFKKTDNYRILKHKNLLKLIKEN
ncbi:MAG: glycosyltransferase family 2 protein [Ignavibacteria bacterium]|nr:glycosyltransferase family 2 protein [Ignavibacteria bacterium]